MKKIDNGDSVSWNLAECKIEDPAIFMSAEPAKEALAKTICQRCVIIEGCLEFALKTDTSHSVGVLGGMNPDERRALKARRKKSI